MRLFADKGYARKGWGARAYLFHAPNYRMNELTGAGGLAQIRKLSGVGAPGAEPAFLLYPLRVDGADPRRVSDAMKEAGFFVLLGYTGKAISLCSESLTSKKTYGRSEWPFTVRAATKTYEYKEGLCPRAEELLSHLLCMPWDESWSEASVERAASVLIESVRAARSSEPSGSPRASSVPAAVSVAERPAGAEPRI